MPSNLVRQTNAARKGFFGEHQELLDRLLTQGQSPQIFFIGCNDSRVMPEAILGANPGDVFVFRSMANIVPPYGLGERAVGASLEYALHHLRVKHIVICGHTDCGGIQALDRRLDQLDEPHLARWVEYARPAQTQVDAWGVDPDTRHQAIVQQNVILQLENLRTYEMVRQALKAGEVTLHGWVYDLSTGWISYWDTQAEQFVNESEMSGAPKPAQVVQKAGAKERCPQP